MFRIPLRLPHSTSDPSVRTGATFSPGEGIALAALKCAINSNLLNILIA